MRRPVIFVLLAGFAAVVLAAVVYSALRKREIEVERATLQSLSVVVAAHDLPIGTKIDQDAVKLVRWSKDSIPPGAFTELSEPMKQFTRTLFRGDENAGVLPLLIPKGMRAMSVPVDEVSDIAGFVEPHSHVDVVVAMAIGGPSGNQPFAKIVLQNVEVLAVAQQIENANADKPQIVRVVTLLVSPADAERLTLASHEGALRLAMRNYTDEKIVATAGADVTQILRPDEALIPVATTPAPHPAANPPAPELPVEIEIMRNGKSVENVAFVHHRGAPVSRAAAPIPTLEPPEPLAASAPPADEARTDDKDDAAPAGTENSTPVAAASPAGVPAIAKADNHVSGLVDAPSERGFTTPHARTIDLP
jgi:pilus assembly protein CpaB